MRHQSLPKGRILVILALAFVLMYPAFIGSASSASPPTPINVSNDVQPSSDGHVAVSGNHVYVVWTASESNGTTQVLYSGSNDSGITWSKPFNISSDVGPASYPRISAFGSNVYVFWDDKSSGSADVWFRVSRNYGVNWATSLDLSSATKTPSRHFRVLVEGNNLYIAWVEKLTKNNEVLFTFSHDAGSNWAPLQDLSNNVNDSINIGLAIIGQNLFLDWMAQPPHFQILQKSGLVNQTSGGPVVTWGNTINISNDTGAAIAPDIFAQPIGAGGNVYIAWQDNTTGNYQTMFRASYNLGANWTAPINLSHDTGRSTNPSIGGQLVGNKAYVYVAWSDTTPGSYSVYLSESNNGGLTFNGPIDLSPSTASVANVKLQVMPHSVLVLYLQLLGSTATAMLRMSQNFGSTFASAVDLGPSIGTSQSAYFNCPSGSPGRSYAVWVGGTPGDGDIYLQGISGQADTLHPTQTPLRMLG